MLLQTFVQLNILLMAAPALAGWVMSPVVHPALAQAAQGVFQPLVRQAEPTPQAVEERHASPQAVKCPAVTCPFVVAADVPEICPVAMCGAPAEPIVTRFNPFPQAARAP